jgi:hypothetical protein
MSTDDDNAKRGEWLDDQNNREYSDNESRRFKDWTVIEEHPDGDKKKDSECIAHRQDIRGGLIADFRLSDNHAAKKCAQRQRGAEGDIGNCRHTNGHYEHRKREELTRTEARNAQQQPRNEARASQDHDCGEHGELQDCDSNRLPKARSISAGRGKRG